jgi:hypothetical protein
MFEKLKTYFHPRLPEFKELAAYENKDRYFYRVARWHWLDDRYIVISDPHGPRMITCDQWPQIVFLAATGKITVAAFVEFFASKYSGNVPEKLDVTIIYALGQLQELRIIEFSDEPDAIKPEHDAAIKAKL